MKELTLYFEYCDWIGIDLKDYLFSLSGIVEVNIDTTRNCVYVKYDSSKINVEIIKYEILFCVDALRMPLITAFDKHNKEVERYTMVVEDICCEFCFKGIVEDLLMTNGINSVNSDFDYDNMFNVHLDVTYDNKVMEMEKILEIEKELNNKN